jgi:hypothetical protein
LIEIHIGSSSPRRSAAWGSSKPGRPKKAGHFDKKARELIALAVAISRSLRRLHHGAYRLLKNATKEEIAEEADPR